MIALDTVAPSKPDVDILGSATAAKPSLQSRGCMIAFQKNKDMSTLKHYYLQDKKLFSGNDLSVYILTGDMRIREHTW